MQRQKITLCQSQNVSLVQKFVGTSKIAKETREFAQKAAESDYTVLLRGETGVGKDLLAELIHQNNGHENPFVVVDCGALTESLSESELFGHARGAFTDAQKEKMGLVRAAEGGTLFFNEIANMSLGLQAKFLRILDKKPFRSVGGMIDIPVKTRIIAATHANLEEAMEKGTFRKDLFYRLDFLTFHIAPLRERREDIPELAETFLNGSPERFSREALDRMVEYDWPGNVRELLNFVQRASLLGKMKELNPKNNDPCLLYSNDKPPITLKDNEREYIMKVLKIAKGNQTKAAIIAGISRIGLRSKMRRFNITYEKALLENPS